MASTPKPKVPELTLKGDELIEILSIVAYRDVDVAIMLARRAGVDKSGQRLVDPDHIVTY